MGRRQGHAKSLITLILFHMYSTFRIKPCLVQLHENSAVFFLNLLISLQNTFILTAVSKLGENLRFLPFKS